MITTIPTTTPIPTPRAPASSRETCCEHPNFHFEHTDATLPATFDHVEQFLAHATISRNMADLVTAMILYFPMISHDDVTQEARITIARNWARDFLGKAVGDQIANARTITRSRALDAMRSARRGTTREVFSSTLVDLDGAIAHAHAHSAHDDNTLTLDPALLVEQAEQRAEMWQLVYAVCESDEEEWIMRLYEQEYGATEIAEIVGLPRARDVINTHTRIVRRARRVLVEEAQEADVAMAEGDNYDA